MMMLKITFASIDKSFSRNSKHTSKEQREFPQCLVDYMANPSTPNSSMFSLSLYICLSSQKQGYFARFILLYRLSWWELNYMTFILIGMLYLD